MEFRSWSAATSSRSELFSQRKAPISTRCPASDCSGLSSMDTSKAHSNSFREPAVQWLYLTPSQAVGTRLGAAEELGSLRRGEWILIKTALP